MVLPRKILMTKKNPDISTETLDACAEFLCLTFPGWDKLTGYKKASRFLQEMGFTVEGWSSCNETSNNENRENLPKRISPGLFLNFLDTMADHYVFQNALRKRKALALAFLKIAHIDV